MIDICGHEEVRDFFTQVIDRDSLSHAYCFVGQDKVGKRTTALAIAANLLHCSVEKLSLQPDFVLVQQEIDPKTEKTKKDITVNQIRELREKMARSSYWGGYKVAIIDQAEKLNSEAANALLKTLEEPGEKTVLFLITADEKQLPETIISRTQAIYFFPVPTDKIFSWLETVPNSSLEKENIVKWCQGLPGLAHDWLVEVDKFKNYQNEVERFQNILGKSFFSKLQAVENLFTSKDQTATRENLKNILGWWQIMLRDIFYEARGLALLTKYKFVPVDYPHDKWLEAEKQIIKARELLDKNVNTKLIIENILLTLP